MVAERRADPQAGAYPVEADREAVTASHSRVRPLSRLRLQLVAAVWDLRNTMDWNDLIGGITDCLAKLEKR